MKHSNDTAKKQNYALRPRTTVALVSVLVLAGVALVGTAVNASENKRSQNPLPDQGTAQEVKNKTTIHETGDGSSTQVTINGESVTVPANGTYQRSSDDGVTSTDIKVDSRNESTSSGNSSSNYSSSKIEVDVQSNSSSD